MKLTFAEFKQTKKEVCRLDMLLESYPILHLNTLFEESKELEKLIVYQDLLVIEQYSNIDFFLQLHNNRYSAHTTEDLEELLYEFYLNN